MNDGANQLAAAILILGAVGGLFGILAGIQFIFDWWEERSWKR